MEDSHDPPDIHNDTSSSRKNSDFFPIKFTKKKEMLTVDWRMINLKLEEQNRIKEQKIDNNDILFSMYDEDGVSIRKRQSLGTLNPSSVKKLKGMIQHKRENKKEISERRGESQEILNEFKAINEMLENKMNLKEKDIEKLISYNEHFRQNSEPNLQTMFAAKTSKSCKNRESEHGDGKFPRFIENSRISLEMKSKSIDTGIFYETPLLERNKLDAIKMLRNKANRNNFPLKIGNLSEVPKFETDHYRLKDNLEMISPKEKKIINKFAFNSNFFSNNASILSNSTQEFFKASQVKAPLAQANSKLLSLMPTRTDVDALDKWLDQMLASLSSFPITSIHEYFHLIQVIYTCCLQELIRQISLYCKDRGLLLKKIWNAYITILENAILEELKTQQQTEKDYLEEITKVHKIYQKEIENNRSYVENTRAENLKLAEIAKTYKENQKFLKKAYRHFEKDYKVMRSQLEISLNEQKVLIDENNRLKLIIETYNEEKDQKALSLDKIFARTLTEAASTEKNIEKYDVIEEVHNTKRKKKNLQRSKVTEIKEVEKQEKSVDTLDLIRLWENECNTDVVFGAKHIVFIEKSTQTIDRNQFMRESKLIEDDIQEIIKENIKKNEIMIIQNINDKKEMREEKKDENNFQMNTNMDDEKNDFYDQSQETEVLEKITEKKIIEKSPRKKVSIVKTLKKVSESMKSQKQSQISQKKIQFEVIVPDQNKPENNEKKLQFEVDQKKPENNEKISSSNTSIQPIQNKKTASFPLIPLENTPKIPSSDNFENDSSMEKASEKSKKMRKSKKKSIFKEKSPSAIKLPSDQQTPDKPEKIIIPQQKSSDMITVKLENPIKLKTILEETEDKSVVLKSMKSTNIQPIDKLASMMKPMNPPTNPLIFKEDIVNSIEKPSKTNSSNSKFKSPPNLKFIEPTSPNPLNSLKLSNIIPKHKKSMNNSNDNSGNNSLPIAESKPYQIPQKTHKTPEITIENDSISRSSSNSNVGSNQIIGVPHSRSVVYRESLTGFKRGSTMKPGGINESKMLKRLVKADENEAQSLGLKVENNKLRKNLEENENAMKELQEKMEKMNVNARELKKNMDDALIKANELEIQKKIIKLKYKKIKQKKNIGFKDKLSIFAESLMEKLLKEMKDIRGGSNIPSFHTATPQQPSSFHNPGSNTIENEKDLLVRKEQKDKEILSPVMQYIKKTQNNQNSGKEISDKINKETMNKSPEKPNNKMFIYRNPVTKNAKVNMYDDLSKKKIDNLISLNTETSLNLHKKTLLKIQSLGAKSYFTKAALLKLISLIYSDKIKNPQNHYNPLMVIAYDFTLNRYGIKKIADTKFMQFLETCCFYSDNYRIQMFSRFLKLFDKFENEEFDFYIKCLKNLDEVYNTGMLFAQDANAKVFCSTEKIIDYIHKFFFKILSDVDFSHLKQKIEGISTGDKKSGGVCDLDMAVDCMIITQRIIRNTVKELVFNLFEALDVSFDEEIRFWQFLIMFRNIERDRYQNNYLKIKNYYQEHCDVVILKKGNQQELSLSFGKMSILCLENGFFSKEKQKEFTSGVDEIDLIKHKKNLMIHWDQRKEIILYRLRNEIKNMELYQKIMEKIDNETNNQTEISESVWLAYRILDEESKKKYTDSIMDELIPKELQAFLKTAEES